MTWQRQPTSAEVADHVERHGCGSPRAGLWLQRYVDRPETTRLERLCLRHNGVIMGVAADGFQYPRFGDMASAWLRRHPHEWRRLSADGVALATTDERGEYDHG